MSVNFTFSKSPKAQADTAVILVNENKKLCEDGKALDKKSGGLIKHSLTKSGNFKGELGETFTITQPEKSDVKRVICLGIGKPAELNANKAETAGGKLFQALKKSSSEKVVFYASETKGLKKFTSEDLTAHILCGVELGSYTFEKYKTQKKDDKQKPLSKVTVTGEVQSKANKLFKTLSQINEGVFLARDLVNEPPNYLCPAEYADIITKELKSLGVKIDILDEKKMEKLGMGAILAVGMGSSRPPRMVVMQWNGGGKEKPVALVGKGVTFDTGGISLKPGANMDEMKMDMGGSAAVVGTMKALALRKSKANVVGIVGLAENMPSHMAYRPGDIITSYAGKTIEILNTDAEGRLVLADCLTHVQKAYKPRMIIDLATLTGAMMIALGHEYCGTFVNDDKLWEGLEKASEDTNEKLWRMPLDPAWKKAMESQVADLQNLGNIGRFAGACTAAGFLEHFIEDDTPWAHMDIAGTAWSKKDKPTVPKFGSGFGVRVLDRLIYDNYES